MSSSEQDKEFRGVLNTILYIGWAILIFHLYVYCNSSLEKLGIPLTILNEFVVSLNNSTHLFGNTWAAKLAALVPLIVYSFGNKARKDILTTWQQVYTNAAVGFILLFGNIIVLGWVWVGSDLRDMVYTITTIGGYLLLMKAGNYAHRIINVDLDNDPFNKDNESFEQEPNQMSNEYSVNIPSLFYFRGKLKKGWVNVINPFRAAIVLGTPGSGKSFAVVNNYIRQHIMKGFTMYIYDFKFPDLSVIAFHYLKKYAHVYEEMYGKVPGFFVINFDDPRRSHRCNPLLPELMTDIVDAQEAARTILLNLNKTWIQKQGDFFVESPINFLTAIIWFMKRFHDRVIDLHPQIRQELNMADDEEVNFCTFPHVIEFANRDYEEIFPIMLALRELENITNPFASALAKGALEQLEGQIASARIPLARLSSPALYWVMTGNDFSLDINNPDDPKILCVGNNPDRQDVYGAALGLYNARLVKLVNRKHQLKSSLIIDELPTIYFRGLDNLIATARSNRVSTCLGLQDLSQLKRDYGDKEATVIFNTVGNVFSGQVVGETAKTLSTRFGKNVQRSQSFNFTERETTTNISTRLDSLIPESVISNLSQGQFVGAVADNFGEVICQKVFNAQLVVDNEMVNELKKPEPIPMLPGMESITQQQLNDTLQANYELVKRQIRWVIAYELNRIRTDESLKYLLRGLHTRDEGYLTREDDDK
ncbi:type IV secretory system conjugative DNA transfer VirD4/TraG family protein [Spirosoma oryzae]|uniref:Type IV secretory system conjugative DNA transfer VirD4/TraG family protein n=2 Tax=Spirosoma oryzae TaxID=1469603 RepID=A0A2T0S322_9BACT|nr:YWFCY domain-containing protein [Spirosoma oryzae]PRY27807.1 type IV secretory system conjugative DNA transfer VirD4/TraG family protein [Spirosoma oryzae]